MEVSFTIKSKKYEPKNRIKGYNYTKNHELMGSKYCNLSYIDSRSLSLFGPYTLLGALPQHISNPKTLKIHVNKNPHLKKLLETHNLNLNNGDFINFLNFSDEHMKSTAYIAEKICNEIDKPVNKARVVKAARLHDIGKIFIPSKILNKPDNLTEDEKKIMSLHTELGYHLLRVLKIDFQTLELIRNHHNYNKNSSLEQQIVSIADVFSALTENRPYKNPMSEDQALKIIKHSDFNKEVVAAMEKVVSERKQFYKKAG